MSRVVAEFKHSESLGSEFVVESETVHGTRDLIGALEQVQRDLNAKLTAIIDAERSSRSPSSTSELPNQPKRQKSEPESLDYN
ncbi:hypothetical protein EV175_005268 [Coemansia sp. RSA 1933]|nr:hypothetical protein EV175_005268 [Coemansia sp. RSA 1933]